MTATKLSPAQKTVLRVLVAAGGTVATKEVDAAPTTLAFLDRCGYINRWQTLVCLTITDEGRKALERSL